MYIPLTPLSFRDRAEKLFRDKIGVVDGDRRFTYGEFSDRGRRLASALSVLGLEKGDRVAYLAYNSAPLLEGYFGVLEAGCVLLPINIRLSARDISRILSDADVSLIVADPDFRALWSRVESALPCRPHVIWLGDAPDGSPDRSYESILAAAFPDAVPPLDIDENDTAELFYTSGTTADPKGVMLTHRNLYLHAMSLLASLHTDDSTVHLHTIPLFHVNGWGTPQALTAMGGTHVMLRRFEAAEVLRLVEEERVTRFFAVPTMLTALLAIVDSSQYDLSSLRQIVTGGAPTPPDMVRRAEQAFGCEVIGSYGLSETSPVLTLASQKEHLRNEPNDERLRHRASTGLPLVGVDLQIVDSSGTSLPWDGCSSGEIVVRSNAVMKGYRGDAVATETAFDGGWFHTGDLATIDAEGYVVITDRKKDIIISGGENISSVEIEKALYEHPAVLEGAVIGVPDPYWGEVPKALVVLLPGARATEADIIAFCRSRLAHFKAPKSVEFLSELPKSGTGKILKNRLRDAYRREEERPVG